MVGGASRTTLVGDGDFDHAYDAGMNEFQDAQENDPRFYVMDIAAIRGQGVTPIPF